MPFDWKIPRGTNVRILNTAYPSNGRVEEHEYNPTDNAIYYWVAISPYYSVLFSENELEVL